MITDKLDISQSFMKAEKIVNYAKNAMLRSELNPYIIPVRWLVVMAYGIRKTCMTKVFNNILTDLRPNVKMRNKTAIIFLCLT